MAVLYVHLSYKKDDKKFIEKAIKLHETGYAFSKTKYGKNAHEKLSIVCLKHGEFKITPNSFLSSKYGCKVCARESSTSKLIENNNGSWSKSDWNKKCSKKGRKALLYIIKMYNEEEEEFFKIGLTNLSVKVRYQAKREDRYEKLLEIESDNSDFIYNLEKILLKSTKKT